jgi:hypothetical protein
MKNAQDLQSLSSQLEAIPAEEIVAPSMPVSTYVQEAEDLNAWMHGDRALLVAHGQPAAMLDSMPIRIGALREAESEWNTSRYEKEEAQAEYEEMVAAASALLVRTTRHYRYAFRRHVALLGRLPNATSWMADADRIQYLNDLAVMGREHASLLQTAGFDLALLDALAAKSDALAEKSAAARNEKASGRGSKAMRDRAYTYLKVAVDEIRAAGRFLFWDDDVRLQGYRSEYVRKLNRGRSDEDASRDGEEASRTGEEASQTGEEASSPLQNAPSAAGGVQSASATSPL